MNKNIAVIFGGRSAEHDVSIITAHTPIISSLLAVGGFDVYPIYITKEGSWYSDPAMNDMAFFKDSDYESKLLKMKKVRILFDGGLKLIWSGFGERIVPIDVVFPAMHGTYGEDGSLMGLLRMASVPFVGCDLTASAVAMDKVMTKQVLFAEGLPVVPYVWFTRSDWENNKEELKTNIKSLNWPLFVKPVHLGSSIGISKVKNENELNNAIEVALHYDNKVLIEESVENLIEVTLPIIGNDEPKLAAIERPLNKTEFFDFSDKYLSGGKKTSGANSNYSEIPADIGEELSAEVNRLGKETYRILGATGIARIDFLIDAETEKIYVNEVNTLPGSLYAHNFKKIGISAIDLVTTLIKLAEDRAAAEKATTYTFASSILKESGGTKNR